MLKKIILLGLYFQPFFTNAQVVLNAQLPAAGLVQKEQLWNLILVNNKEDILDVRIQMNLQDVQTGQVVLSASTGNILIGKGVKVITSRDIQPIIYNYNVPEVSGSYLPMGSYTVCYQVSNNIGEDRPFVQECIRFNIDPLSPPLLNTPVDKAEIESPYPQFTWLPPSPYEMFTNLSYDLLVTELLEGQSATEAIQYNTPIYSKSSITQPYESYASSFTRLDTGKIYAWQVIAKNGLNYAAKTDVWTFRIKSKDIPIDIVSLTPFVKLKTNNPEKGIAPNGILKIHYNNRYSEKNVKIEILELGNSNKEKPVVFETNLIQGENNIQYDLKKIMQPNEDKVYIARLVNMQNETWFIRFIIKYYK